MNISSPSLLIAATGKSGILLHDIMGTVAVGVLLLLGVLFYKYRLKKLTHTAHESQIGQKIGQIQLWVLYFLVLGVTVFFFFILPRITSLETQREREKVPSEHAD